MNAECASSGVRGGEGELVSWVELLPEGVLSCPLDLPDGCVDAESVSETDRAGPRDVVDDLKSAADVLSSDEAESRGADDELGENSFIICGVTQDSSLARARQGSSWPDPGPSNDCERRRSARSARSASVLGGCRRSLLIERERVGDWVLGDPTSSELRRDRGDTLRGVVGELRLIASKPMSKLKSRSGSCSRCSDLDGLTGDQSFSSSSAPGEGVGDQSAGDSFEGVHWGEDDCCLDDDETSAT